jgi:hypothetical protein
MPFSNETRRVVRESLLRNINGVDLDPPRRFTWKPYYLRTKKLNLSDFEEII